MIISVKYVNFPRPGGKYGNLKTTDGENIMCPPDMLEHFRAGQTYDVPTKQQTWGQGTDQERDVTIVAGRPSQGHTGAVQGPGGGAGYQPPSQSQGPQRSNAGFQPRVIPGGASPYGNAVTGPPSDQSRHIFITGVVGRAMGSGKFVASEIPVLTQAANEAYDRLERLLRGLPAAPPPRTLQPELAGEPPLGELGDPGPELQ